MHRSRAKARKARAIPRTVALALMTTPLFCSGWAASDPTCGRYSLHEVAPGMSRDIVRSKVGREGVSTLIRNPGTRETSGIDYPGSKANVFVEYDHRVDRRSSARAVRVRVPMPLSSTTAQSLVSRFGPPDAGANELVEGLPEGAAVWVNEACGVVLTAYRSNASWWTADSRTFLQVETLDLARKGNSPASPLLGAILARKNGPPAAPARKMAEASRSPLPLSMRVAASANDAPPPPSPPRPVEPVVTASPQPLAKPVVAPPPAPKPWAPIKPKDGPAERMTFVPPRYPATAKWLGVKGHVDLAIIVRADGSVANRPRVVAARPTGRGFEQAAVDAVQKWRFKPALRGGRPVESNLRIDVDFE